jgi:hypothetical protein
VVKKLAKIVYTRYIYPKVLVYVKETSTEIDDSILSRVNELILKALS